MRDLLFEWTSGINDFMEDHVAFKKTCIIVSSSCLDFLQVSAMVLYYRQYKSVKLVLSFSIFFITRAMI